MFAILAQQSCNKSVVDVGFCIASIDKGKGAIESLYTSNAFRGQGVGERLLQQAVVYLRQENAKVVRLLVGQGNEEVITFYQKYGFVKRATQMELLD